MSATTTAPAMLLDKSYLRIKVSEDGQRYEMEWSYQGRDDLQGLGWVARIVKYDPTSKWRFERQFVGARGVGMGVVPVAGGPVVLQYSGLYDGGSKYGYDKHGGEHGMLVLENGECRKIKETDAIAILSRPKAETSPLPTSFLSA